VVVTYIEPRAGNASALGFDVASDPGRRTSLEQARASGSPAATQRIRLVQETGDQFGFLVFVPAFGPGSSAAAEAASGQAPEAYALGVFRVGDMLDTLLGAEDRQGLRIQLRDESAPEPERLLLESEPGPTGKPPVFERSVRFPMAGREWALVFGLSPDHLAAQRPWQAWSVLAAGLLFGGLLGAFLLVVTGRTIEIEQQVRDRTAELQEANAQLSSEVLERQRTERELQHVMSSVSDCLWAARVQPGGSFRYVYCSPAIERIAGRPPDFFAEGRQRWLETVHADDRGRVAGAFERLLKRESSVEDAEYRLVLPDGSLRWARESIAANLSPDGALHLSGVISDVTAHKQAERLMREREAQEAAAKRDERFRSLIENASDVILVLDGGATVRYVSPSVEPILGRSAAELAGQDVLELVAPENQRELAEELSALAGPAHHRAAGTTQGRGGRLAADGGHGAEPAGEAGGRGYVVNCREVTERARLEDQLRQSQKMEAVGRLAGGIAHDLNNRRVEQIRKAAERASGLVRQLLAFGRKQLQRLEVLDLNLIAGDMGKMLWRGIGEDIELVTSLGAQLGRVRADPGQVEQILMNLALNARDAMPAGGKLTSQTANVELGAGFAETHPGVEAGPYVMLAVSDTGHGMDDDTLSHIFEPFFTTKGEGKGTGLGLATVYGIVKQSGGYVDVTSAVGSGTTFRVYLPRLEEQEARPRGRPRRLPRRPRADPRPSCSWRTTPRCAA
jgi:PAS domain S-box-containing protein